jgi:hypothetical protein
VSTVVVYAGSSIAPSRTEAVLAVAFVNGTVPKFVSFTDRLSARPGAA